MVGCWGRRRLCGMRDWSTAAVLAWWGARWDSIGRNRIARSGQEVGFLENWLGVPVINS